MCIERDVQRHRRKFRDCDGRGNGKECPSCGYATWMGRMPAKTSASTCIMRLEHFASGAPPFELATRSGTTGAAAGVGGWSIKLDEASRIAQLLHQRPLAMDAEIPLALEAQTLVSFLARNGTLVFGLLMDLIRQGSNGSISQHSLFSGSSTQSTPADVVCTTLEMMTNQTAARPPLLQAAIGFVRGGARTHPRTLE
eukprot:CAMPEP_0117513292 /NCGR_PEP_ID=MMETSP0784-20121206/29477_1 /TAXON_ID=39447 /ORGANISM="" /LENGTH=196 /DNA_ID=CAMNT_0005309049 /DNA_START=81 /DNA_END=668 /DNA_ORIENTATION=+